MFYDSIIDIGGNVPVTLLTEVQRLKASSKRRAAQLGANKLGTMKKVIRSKDVLAWTAKNRCT